MDFLEYINSTAELGDPALMNNTFHWKFWTLIVVNLMALAYVRTAQPGYISVLFKTGIYNRQIYQNIQEDLRLNSFGSVMLTLASFNCTAIILSTLVSGAESRIIWLLLIAFTGVVIIKFVIIRLLGFIFESRDGLSEHWMNHLIYFQLVAVILTPVLALTHFLAQSVQGALFYGFAFFLVTAILVSEAQSIIRALRQRVSIVYIILYLCALELIPLIVLIRVLVR